MIRDSRHVVRVSLVKGEETLFSLVVPHLHVPVITSRHEMGTVESNAEVQTIHTCLVTNQTVVRVRLFVCHCPDLYCLIKRSTRKHGGILWVDGYLHDVVLVVLI